MTVETTVEYLEVLDEEDTTSDEDETTTESACDVNIVSAVYGVYDALSVVSDKYAE